MYATMASTISHVRNYGEYYITCTQLWLVLYHMYATVASTISHVRNYGEYYITCMQLWLLLCSNSTKCLNSTKIKTITKCEARETKQQPNLT